MSEARYYYVKLLKQDRGLHRVGCVCVIPVQGSDTVCRGISICSEHDQFDARKARKISGGRALKAYHTHRDSDKAGSSTSLSRFRFGLTFHQVMEVDYLSQCDRRPTAFERKILGRTV